MGRSVGRSVGWFGWLVGRSVGRLVGLVGCLVGRLVFLFKFHMTQVVTFSRVCISPYSEKLAIANLAKGEAIT